MTISKNFIILISILVLGGIFVLAAERFFEICPDDLIACPEEAVPPSDDSRDTELPDDGVACTMDAKQCPDGSYVGRIAPDCAFAPCPTSNQEVTFCADSSRNVDACIEIYQPVCASVAVQCITAPCDPVPQTYSNSCFACSDENVISYTAGECAN